MLIQPTIHDKEYSSDLYSRFFEDRIIFIFGEINDDMAANVITQLLYLDSISSEDITIYINSPGGSVSAGLAIIDTMKYINSDVSTLCIGLAASMASLILSSGARGKRHSLTNADVMIHQPLGSAVGQATDIMIVSNRIVELKKRLNTILSENTNKKLSTIMKDTERDFYMSSKEALEYGIIDSIKEKKKEK